jgi:hypothetical protein
MASTDLPATPATLVQQIASNVLSVAAAAIPLAVVEHTKALIFDSIGCALAATEEPAFARASRVFAQLGGNPDCTVIGSARRVNLPQAVLLNGILIRSLDLNDAYIGPGQMGHPSDNIAVALSVGEKAQHEGQQIELFRSIQPHLNLRPGLSFLTILRSVLDFSSTTPQLPSRRLPAGHVTSPTRSAGVLGRLGRSHHVNKSRWTAAPRLFSPRQTR